MCLIVFACLLKPVSSRFWEDFMYFCLSVLACFPCQKTHTYTHKKSPVIWSSRGHTANSLALCTHSVLPPTAELRLNGLSGIILRLIRAQWLCMILVLCVNQSAAAVICETCCMCRTRPPNVPFDGVTDSWLPFEFYFELISSGDFSADMWFSCSSTTYKSPPPCTVYFFIPKKYVKRHIHIIQASFWYQVLLYIMIDYN